MYYVPIGLDNSSINVVSGFENTKYILLYSSTEMFLYELKGNAPKFVTNSDLVKIRFEPEGDYYLAFKIKSLTEVKVDDFDLSTIDLSTLDMFSTTMYNYVPYFTTFTELNKLRINY